MENKKSLSKNKLNSIHEEKLIREVDYDTSSSTTRSTHQPKGKLHLDLEILQKSPSHRQELQKVLVSIKPRAPAIKTLYIAEKNRFHSKKISEKSGSRLAIGDHSSFTTHYSDDEGSTTVNSIACETEGCTQSEIDSGKLSSISIQIESSPYASQCSQLKQSLPHTNIYNNKQKSAEKCYVYTQPRLNMNLGKIDNNIPITKPEKVDIATLIITNGNSTDFPLNTVSTISKLNKRIDHLERKILRQEMVFRSIDPNVPLSSSDEETNEHMMRSTSETGRPGCSYIEQYSHVPETSAFQRYAQQAPPLSPSKATTLEKEHNSEQYGRDFTAYDGITTRGKRQCASVPCKRDDVPKMAAERVHKIRHKLNPVRDYRLMDTVHYLAQGEFAPRDDGIKLTPSREAVLSDIIWEDVCRTHWPNTRLARRGHSERYSDRGNTRYELQRLIDGLLRERVAHVERRRRRHYRIVKLNHRHESCKPIGKTGDIIVASHKNRQNSENVAASDHNTASAVIADSRWENKLRRNNKSNERIPVSDMRNKRRSRPEVCYPGPSYASRSSANREPTCCYHASNTANPDGTTNKTQHNTEGSQNLTSVSSMCACKPKGKKPRLVVKKDVSRRKHSTTEEPNLEHYILLPTLVVRTPSNVKRQKKFNELYHRILNVQLNNEVYYEATEQSTYHNTDKKDIGFNINIISDSTENLKNNN